jgi:hypothetical protein
MDKTLMVAMSQLKTAVENQKKGKKCRFFGQKVDRMRKKKCSDTAKMAKKLMTKM